MSENARHHAIVSDLRPNQPPSSQTVPVLVKAWGLRQGIEPGSTTNEVVALALSYGGTPTHWRPGVHKRLRADDINVMQHRLTKLSGTRFSVSNFELGQFLSTRIKILFEIDINED